MDVHSSSIYVPGTWYHTTLSIPVVITILSFGLAMHFIDTPYNTYHMFQVERRHIYSHSAPGARHTWNLASALHDALLLLLLRWWLWFVRITLSSFKHNNTESFRLLHSLICTRNSSMNNLLVLPPCDDARIIRMVHGLDERDSTKNRYITSQVQCERKYRTKTRSPTKYKKKENVGKNK